MGDVIRLKHDEIGPLLDKISELYVSGELKAISVQVLLQNGECGTGYAGDIDFLTLIGLIETAKLNRTLSASGLI
jgi:hypothetical protein